MLHHKSLYTAAVSLFALLVCQTAGALGIRLDSGDWDTVVSTDSNANASVNQAIGFDMSIFGVTGDTATVNADGSVVLSGGAETAVFNTLFDGGQTAGGNVVQYSIEQTNAAFAAPGVAAGIRFTWNTVDSSSALLNSFQLAFFELASGQFALEFNYDRITFGDNGTQVGYSTSLGASFDLAGALGLDFADYQGIGDFDPGFPDLCLSTPDALACNNYFNGSFGPSADILPGIAGGYFRSLSGTDNTPVQGRYLWLSDAALVAEPTSLALLALGALVLVTARRRG